MTKTKIESIIVLIQELIFVVAMCMLAKLDRHAG